MKVRVLKPEHVLQLPDQLEEGALYICEEFDLTAHKCCCGCGEDVFLKLGPAKWRLSKMPDGSVSLEPSVGNWNYSCKSHYWITKNRVIDAAPMNAFEIEAVKRRDRRDRDRHIAQVNAKSEQERGVWRRIRSLATGTLRRLKAAWPW